MNSDSYILVVDDQMANIEALGELLADQYDVHFALSGQAALAQVAKSKPDLILLDIMMPDMDGYAVCRQLQSQLETADIPVMFITALATPDEETRGLDAGAVDYIVKPFNPTIVRARVRNHLAFKHAKDQLRLLAQTDGLTGLANRRYLFERLQAELERVREQAAQPFSLILIDVDHFKHYNDSQGHVAGDLCLQRVAGVLKAELRNPDDMMARYGGEEFCCLLPHTGLADAEQIALRICRRINELAIPNADVEHDAQRVVTVSAGVALCTAAMASVETLLQQADRALYTAKAAGRNQVKVWV
ncbi:diguanylate cyclase [Chitinibacter sp. FCG-7]|uniref:diguanylate cyclase n=1 Tax=Chitinibacter mangrovi TaxID=3153927 RepID=A0AAU7F7D1_9NEIS